MKILLATDAQAPDATGPSQLVQRLAEELVIDHDVHVVRPALGWRASSHRSARGVVEHRLRSVSGIVHSRSRIGLPWTLRAQARSLLRSVRPDVVHVHSQLSLGREVTVAARRLGVVVIATCHLTPDRAIPPLPVSTGLQHRLNRWAWRDAVRTLGHADVVTAPTPHAAVHLVAAGLKAPVLPISSGVDLARFHPAVDGTDFRRARALTAAPTLLHVGRLVPDGHVDELIEAVAVLRKQRNVQLLVVGEGPERTRLEALAAARGVVELVTFSGALPTSELPQAYAAADVFCISARGTLQSAATLEAMASGLPVVAVDVGTLTQLIHHGDNGLLYLRGNVQDFAARVMTLLDDPAASRRMGRRSRGIATEHGAALTTHAFTRLYRTRQSGSAGVVRPMSMVAVP